MRTVFLHAVPAAFHSELPGSVLVPKHAETRISKSKSKANRSILRIPGSDKRLAQVEKCVWEWKPKLKVHYKTAGSGRSPALLMLPGFGVGAFHYANQLRELGRDFRVWAVDFAGQGQSLPCEDPAPSTSDVGGDPASASSSPWGFGPRAETWANELVFSVDLWRQQILDFVDQVIQEPVYIVGNSLGGFVGLYFSACNPHLVKGIALLNATPFWAFIPNSSRSPTASKFFPWAGNFPLPPLAKKLVNFTWKRISDPKSIESVLKQVYVDQSVLSAELLQHILEATEHPAAAAVFASILFAPQGHLSFNEALHRCWEAKIPICLIYGKEDPWVTPTWGRRIKRQVPEALYYEISPAGHCPHSEVPEVVNFLLHGWVRSLESEGMLSLPLFDDSDSVPLEHWKAIEFSRMGSIKSVQVRVVGNTNSYR